MGYGYIAAPQAEAIQTFYEEHFNAYLNFHRPCGVPEETVNAKGKVKRVYRWYATPWEILRPLPGLAGQLKPEVTGQMLDCMARAQTGTAAATEIQLPTKAQRMRKKAVGKPTSTSFYEKKKQNRSTVLAPIQVTKETRYRFAPPGSSFNEKMLH